jgi:hypothetical protein
MKTLNGDEFDASTAEGSSLGVTTVRGKLASVCLVLPCLGYRSYAHTLTDRSSSDSLMTGCELSFYVAGSQRTDNY